MPDNEIDLASATADTGQATKTPPPPRTRGDGVEREFTIKARTQREIILHRFLQHRMAVFSLGVLILVAVFAFVGGAVWHFKYNVETNDIVVAPSGTHPFGTDSNGYDEMAAVMRGTQRSLEIALTVSILATTFGTIYGAVSGFYRGWVDTILMRIADVILPIPILAVAALLGDRFGQKASSWLPLALIISALIWPVIARVVRGQVLSLREKEYVEAARALGAPDRRIIFRHILPNTAGPIIVIATLTVATAILLESALSYLGFGVHPPDTSLGLLISNAQDALQSHYDWLFWFPGLFIILIALSINFIGDGLRDAFDPTQTRVRA